MIFIAPAQCLKKIRSVEVTSIGNKTTGCSTRQRFFYHFIDLHNFSGICRVNHSIARKLIFLQLFNCQNRVAGFFPGFNQLPAERLFTKNYIVRIGHDKWLIVYKRFNQHQGVPCAHHSLLAQCKNVGFDWFYYFQFFNFVGLRKCRRQLNLPIKIILHHFLPA